VKNEGNAVRLYESQVSEHTELMDKMKKNIKNFEPYSFKPVPIIIEAERKSGYILIEGSQKLSEEISMIQGLDPDELKNYYLVANCTNVLEKYSKLENIINN
jgi:adenylosuccinate synthase